MNSTAELIQAYEQWRSWTQTETAALQRSDWPVVAQCQQAKQQLPRCIQELTETVRASLGGLISNSPEWRHLQALGAELIALESSNAELLTRRIRANRARAGELAEANRNLGRVHRSYGAVRGTASCSYC